MTPREQARAELDALLARCGAFAQSLPRRRGDPEVWTALEPLYRAAVNAVRGMTLTVSSEEELHSVRDAIWRTDQDLKTSDDDAGQLLTHLAEALRDRLVVRGLGILQKEDPMTDSPLAGWTDLHVIGGQLYGHHPTDGSMAPITAGVRVPELAQAQQERQDAQDILDRLEGLTAEYRQEDWSEPLNYQPQGMDLPPALYAWGGLDTLMSHSAQRLKDLLEMQARGHVTAEYVLMEHAHAVSLYRHILRTLVTREGRPTAPEGP